MLDADVDVLDALVTRARSRDLDTVIVGGEPVLRDGSFTQLDEEGIRNEISDALRGPLPEDVAERRRLSIEIEPYIRRFYADWDVPTGSYHQYNSVA